MPYKKSEKKKSLLILIGILLVVLAAIACLIFAFVTDNLSEMPVPARVRVLGEYKIAEDNFITDVVIGDEIVRDNCALTIYVVRDGDTVWSIAKDMGVSPDLIYAQNEIEGELNIGDKLVIYAPSSVYVS